ncbi:hypothetical protein ACOMHN_043013 [Nucella lapillus]
MAPQLQVSLLVVCLFVGSASSQGGLSMLGGFNNPYMLNPLMRSLNQNLNRNGNQQQVDPNLLTCIGADANDLQSQIRLTIHPMDIGRSPLGPLGFGGMGGALGGQSPNSARDWTVNGMLLPSQVVQKAGSYQMAVFKGGRTFGECKSTALGEVLNAPNGGQMGYMGHMGPMGPMGLGGSPFSHLGMGGFNPLASMMGQMNQQQGSGMISNPAIIGQGNTVYSGMIRQVSRNQLVGRSVAACQSIQNGRCLGAIAYCCTITRDSIPATEVFVDAVVNPNVNAFRRPFGMQQGGALFGAGALTGVPIGGRQIRGASVLNVIDDDDVDGLF